MPEFLEFKQKTKNRKQFGHLRMTSPSKKKKTKAKNAEVTEPKAS